MSSCKIDVYSMPSALWPSLTLLIFLTLSSVRHGCHLWHCYTAGIDDVLDRVYIFEDLDVAATVDIAVTDAVP